MNGMEILTAAEHDVPVVSFINNNGHNITHHCSKICRRHRNARRALQRELDIAKNVGSDGRRFVGRRQTSMMAQALGEALASGGPCRDRSACRRENSAAHGRVQITRWLHRELRTT